MFFLSFIIILFIFLIAISIINLFLSFAIKLVTNNSVEEYKVIIPSTLYLIISGITFIIMYFVTIDILDLSIKDSVMAIIFKTVDINSKLKTIIILNSIITIISILIQSLCLLTVNIDYTVTFGKIRMFFKGIIKKFKQTSKKNSGNDNESKESNTDVASSESNIDCSEDSTSNLAAVIPENQMAENKEKLKLGLISSIICTFFIFSFLLFVFMSLFTVGSIVAAKFF